MSLSAHALKQQFYEATHAIEELQARPVYFVERSVFEEITVPIKKFLQNDPAYAKYETGVAFQLENVLQLLQDAWVKEVNSEKGEFREGFRNALQGIMEVLQDATQNIIPVDYEDIHGIVKYRMAVNDGADIHERFMGNETQASTLREFSENIYAAHNRRWDPSIPITLDHTQPSANDGNYDQPAKHTFDVEQSSANDEEFYQPKQA